MDTYDQLFTTISAKQAQLEEIALEEDSLEWAENPSGDGSIERPYNSWAPSEKRRYMEITDTSSKLDEEIYKAQLFAEEHLDEEHLDRLIDAIGERTWNYYRTMYMPMR